MKYKLRDIIKPHILNVLKEEIACINRKHVAVLVVLLLIALNNFFSFHPFRFVTEFNQDDAVPLYPDSVIRVVGVEHLETGEYLAFGHSPMFHIYPPNQIISSTRVVFRDPVKNYHSVQVYYATENEGLSELSSVRVLIPSGAYDVILNLPSDIYSSFRYDINIFSEPFEIVGIYASESPAQTSRKWIDNTDGILMPLIICLLIILAWFFTVRTGIISKLPGFVRIYFLNAFGLMILLLISLCVMFLWYDFSHVRPVSTVVSNLIENSTTETVVGELIQNKEIRQTFFIGETTIPMKIHGFSVQFATYERQNTGSIHVELRIGEDVVYESIIQLPDIADGELRLFTLSNPISITTAQAGELAITSLDGQPGNAVTIFASEQPLLRSELFINGVAQAGYISFQVLGNNTGFILTAYWLFATMLIFALLTLFYFMFIKKAPIEKIFLIVVIVIGLTYTFLLPPASIHDEHAHIRTAYGYSNRLFFRKYENMRRSADLNHGYFNNFNPIPGAFSVFRPNPGIAEYRILHSSLFRRTSNIEPSPSNNLIHTNEVHLYLFSIIGITVGRLLNLDTAPMLMLGRLFNFSFFVTTVYFAIKIIPIGKMLIFSIALFPMTMQQAASFSSDSVINGLAFLIVAFIFKLIYSNTKISIQDFIVLGILSALIAPAKGGAYMPLVFLCLLIPKENIPALRKFKYFHAKILLVSIASFLFFNHYLLLSILGFGTSSAEVAERRFYSFSFIFNDPGEFILILIRTFELHFPSTWFFEAVGYAMGWTNIPWRGSMPVRYMHIMFGFTTVLLLSTLESEIKYKIASKGKLIICLVILASAGMAILAMFLGFTPFGHPYIRGVQGRYFLPVFPLIFLLISRSVSFVELKRNINNTLIIAIFFLHIFHMQNVFRFVINS